MNALLSTGIFSLICNYIDDTSVYGALCLTSRRVRSVARRACTSVEVPLSLVTSLAAAEQDGTVNKLSFIPQTRCISANLSSFEFTKVFQPMPNQACHSMTSTVISAASKLFPFPQLLIIRNEIDKELGYDSDGWHAHYRFSFCELHNKFSLYMNFFELIHHLVIENFRGIRITDLLPLFPCLRILEVISHADGKCLKYEEMTTVISAFTPQRNSTKSSQDPKGDFKHRYPLEKLVLGWKLDASILPTIIKIAQYASLKHLVIYESTDELVQSVVKPLCFLQILEVKRFCPTVPSALDIMSLPHMRRLILTGVAKDYSSQFSIDLNLSLLPNLLECDLKYISITDIILPKPNTDNTIHHLRYLRLEGCMIYLYGSPVELPQCELNMTDCWVAKGGHFCVKSLKQEDVVGEGVFTVV